MTLTVKHIIQKTIAAHGGAVWKHPETLQLNGSAVMYPENGTEIILDTYAMWRVFPKTNTHARKANGKVALLAMSGAEVFFDLRFDGSASRFLLSDQAKKFQDHFKWTNNFGFGIIRFALDRNLECTLTDSYHFGTVPCHYIVIKDASGQETIFGIRKEDFRILYMGFDTPLGFHLRVYGHFKSYPETAFLMPLSLCIYYDNVRWFDVRWHDFVLNRSIAPKVFEIN
ncbi:MAG: hypothetical protein AAF934_03680 [Bacteroidota bacterium]